MKKLLILSLLWILILWAGSVLAEPVEISAVQYPPFLSETKYEDIGHGTMGDITDAMFKKAGYQTVFVYLPHKRSTMDFISGKYPFILNSRKIIHAAGLKADDYDHISLGYYNAYFFYLKSHLKKEFTWTTYSDLKGYRVCVTRGSYIIPFLDKAGVEVEGLNTSISCMKKLFLKRSDIWGSIDNTAYYLVNKYYPDTPGDFTYAVPPKGSYGARDEMILGFLKANKSAGKKAEKLAAALDQMKKDGSFLNILKKYWGGEVPKNVLPLDMQ